MEALEGPTAPQSGNDNQPQIPTFEELAADPEIAALLDFEPVPRAHAKANGWSPDMQRMFIAWLAYYGSPTNACDELGKARSGIDKVFKSPGAEEFCKSWEGAIALAEKRRIAAMATRRGGAGARRAPSISRRLPEPDPAPLPGQVLNEYDEWEEEDSYNQRATDAKNSVSGKLLRCRRMYLQQIAGDPGKRAAFEILTEYPVDWDKARNLEEQDDEPFNIANQRQPDMVLTAQAGWFGDFAHGRNRMAEARAAVDAWRAEQGLPAVDWSEDAETSEPAKGHAS